MRGDESGLSAGRRNLLTLAGRITMFARITAANCIHMNQGNAAEAIDSEVGLASVNGLFGPCSGLKSEVDTAGLWAGHDAIVCRADPEWEGVAPKNAVATRPHKSV
jgi:hypothetical protein